MSQPAEEFVLHVVMNGRVIGDVQRTGPKAIRLRYSNDPGPTPLSTSMADRAKRYRDKALTPWLDGLLPDRPETLRQWRRRFKVADDTSTFALLRHVGEDVAGAAQFVRPDRLDTVLGGRGTLTALTDNDIAEMLRRAKADLPVNLDDSTTGKFSLAGAQAKIALHRTDGGWSDPSGAIPSTHIVKPAIPGMDDQDLVEAVTMRTAKAVGLRVATVEIAEFTDERAIVVSRYDRRRTDDRFLRVHQEDMCQALTEWPGRKYESQGGPTAARVADLIHATSSKPAEDTRRFAQALIFNWLTCGTDAHARNYSLLLSGDTARLAPLYDLNSHLAYADGTGTELSMSVEGTFRATAITARTWKRAAKALHVGADWLLTEIDRQAAELPAAIAKAATSRDVARYDSPTIARLVNTVEQWVKKRTG